MAWTRIFFAASVALITSGCPGLGSEQPPTSDELPEEPTWSEHVKPIMDKHCNECHSVPPREAAPGTLRLDTCETVDGIPGAQTQAARIIVRTIDKTPTPMPPATYETTPTPDEEEILQRWVDQGASCDGSGTPNGTPNGNTNGMTGDMGNLDAGMDAGMDVGVDMVDAADMMDEPEMYDGWQFADVVDFLQANCSPCHSVAQGNLMIDPNGDDAAIEMALQGDATNPAGVPFITPNDPANSAIFVRMNAGEMPPNNAMPTQTMMLEEWINAGAPGFQAQ